jgi:hypothetical protein
MDLTSAIGAASKVEPLTLAILFIGLISLGVLGLAVIVIRLLFKGNKK